MSRLRPPLASALFLATAAALGFAAAPLAAKPPKGTAVAPAASAAQSSPPAPLLLAGPEVTKLDWNTRALRVADLDRDGLADLVLINNDSASLEILWQRDPAAPASAPRRDLARNRWEPELEDARFRKESLVIGQNLFDLVTGDFNGDGRLDLAFTGEPIPLQVRHGQADGTWTELTFPTAPAPLKVPDSLVAADVDGDGLTDLVSLGQKEIVVFLQKPGVGLVQGERIALSDDTAYGLGLRDLDGDGRPDIHYLASGSREALRVRRQVAPGRFGPELSFGLKTPRSVLLSLLDAKAPASSPPRFASALGATGQIEFVSLTRAPADDPWGGLVPRAFTPLAGAKSQALYALGDFNGDGASDLAVAYAETAQVFVYFRQPDGGYTVARRAPSLTDARALASVRWTPDGPHSLLVLSGKENTLAEIAFAPDGTARAPRGLAVGGRLITLAAGPLTSDGRADSSGFVLVAEEDGKRVLGIGGPGPDGELKRGPLLPLPALRTDPRAMTLVDINQDGFTDVLLSVPSLGVKVYLQKPNGSGAFADAADLPAFRPGLLARPEAALSPLTVGDADGDGRPELLVSAENFIRALRIEADGSLAIVAQFDAREPGAEVTTGFIVPAVDSADAPRVILHDRKAEQLHLLTRPAGATTHEIAQVRPVARLEVTGAAQTTGPAGRRELLLFGKDRFWWMPSGAPDFALKTDGSYASDLTDVDYDFLLDGDLDRDGRTDLVAIDTDEAMVEFLTRDADGEWQSRMHFKVFETDPHANNRRGDDMEPREALLADVTGDGRPDLVLLVHDRVLVYPQE